MKKLALAVAVLLLASAALFLALGTDEGGSGSGRAGKGANSGGSKSGKGGDAGGGNKQAGSGPVLAKSSCPPDLSNCVVASGTVIYVEAVDPDGDGDAHFVTTSEEGVTFPGVTVFDVRTDLRPEPLPGIGDLVGGAGQVSRGSHGQKQIEVLEFHVAR